jgi:pre-mRNA-processing factor 8
VRAISASSLHLRTNHLYVASDVAALGTASAPFTYVLPKNILKKFIVAGDLRTQCGALLWGCSPGDNPAVKEIRALGYPPQSGNHGGVAFPSGAPPPHPALAGLEPLGWVHSAPRELPSLPPSDALTHARMLASYPGWAPASAICLVVSFTPGSASLAAYRLTPGGVEWGAGVLKDPVAVGVVMGGGAAPGYTPATHTAKAPLLLSDRFAGAVLAPGREGVWNYAFQGVRFSDAMKYEWMVVPSPLPFFAEEHRPNHFIAFNAPGVGAAGGAGGGGGGGREGEDAELRGADAFA